MPTELSDRAEATRFPLLTHISDFVPFPATDLGEAVADRFAQQVVRFGDRIAVRTRSVAWTYSDLDRRANRVAQAVLAARGTGPEPVAVLVDRTAAVYPALLGVLKAGKFYVPFSPEHPRERNALLLEDSGARLVVTDGRNAAEAQALAGADRVVDMDAFGSGVSDAAPEVAVSLDDPVYILYTSGTTGRPKGVLDTHRNLLNNIRNYTNEYRLAPSDRLSCFGSHVYSGSLKDIYGALLNGATLYPVDVATEGLAGLAGWVAAERVTVLDAVPPLFRQFVASLTGAEDLSAVRIFRLGGAAVTTADVELFRRHFGRHCVLVNGYGATETGTACTFDVWHDTPLPRGTVPLGRPPEGITMALVGPDGREVPTGEVGEIAVRSDHLARGYWQRPDLTAEAFRTDVLALPGRVYLTGDFGSRLPDGTLVGVGRKDSQVRVRGYRVELAEVEAELLRHPRVREAAVVLRIDDRPEPYLAGYFVVDAKQNTLDVADLRRHLASRLPDYAVPATLVALPMLPVTVNGKLNRDALPIPPRLVSGRGVPPRTEAECRMTEIWQTALGLTSVGTQDDFFALGGTSLAAARLMVEVGRAFGVDLPLTALREARTVESLTARVVGGCPGGAEPVALVPLRATGTLPPLFVFHALGGEVLTYEALTRHLGPDQPVYGVRARVPAEGESPVVTVEGLAAGYADELIRAQPTGSFRLCGYSQGGVLAYEVARQLVHSGRLVSSLLVIDHRRPGRGGGGRGDLPSVIRATANLPRWAWAELTEAGCESVWTRGRRKARAILRRVSGRSPDVTDVSDLSVLPDRFRELWRSLFHAGRAYRPRPYSGRVWLFRASSQPLLPGEWHRWDMGWGELAGGGVTVTRISGRHDSVMAEPTVQRLAAELRRILAGPAATSR